MRKTVADGSHLGVEDHSFKVDMRLSKDSKSRGVVTASTLQADKPGLDNEDPRVMTRKPLPLYHEQLADKTLGPVHLTVIRTCPLPEVEKEDYYLHLGFLLALLSLYHL